jgi:transposase InsO family protein
MEADWIVARAQLRAYLSQNPQASHRAAAAALGYSRSWVRKWRQRLASAPPDDEAVLHSRSRRAHTCPRRIAAAVEERVVGLRLSLGERFHRKVGGWTILHYLAEAETREPLGSPLPRSPTTIWRILRRRQYILPKPRRVLRPFERPAPLQVWEVDFCTAVNRALAVSHKQANAIEVFNIVDRGTSLALASLASSQYDAEQALATLLHFFESMGLPQGIVCDNDPRLVGSGGSDRFPTAWLRSLACLGITVDVLRPYHPEDKPFVERFNRTLQAECLREAHPTTVPETNAALAAYLPFYNEERPHQGDACQNRPPRQVFPLLPRLPGVPAQVNPDAWLKTYAGQRFRRQVDSRGAVQLGKYPYFVGRLFRGRRAVLRLDAEAQVFQVEVNGQVVKALPIRGLYGRWLSFEEFVGTMCDEARSEWQRYLWKERLKHIHAQAG